MARCLIIACGCRGLELARALRADGHAVRASTRDPARLPTLEAEGIEALLGDPDRVATLAPALDHVAVAYILLGSATGTADAVRALHSTRLDMLLTKIVDSTVRGIVYEGAGSVDADVLAGGAARVRAFAQDARVPHVVLEADPGDSAAWLIQARSAVAHVLAAPV
jgi:putative NADH-flavin reductase